MSNVQAATKDRPLKRKFSTSPIERATLTE